MNDAHLLFENISSLWPIVLSLVFVLVWLVRIESKVLYLEKAHDDEVKNKQALDDQIWEKLDEVQKSLSKITESLARLEGRLDQND
jgi:hypothetical protein